MLKEIMPPNLLADENIKALIESIEPEFEKVKEQIVNVLIYTRIDELPEEVLDSLAWQFHIEGYELAKTIEEKRKLIKSAFQLHKYKGTKYAIEKACELLNIKGKVKEWFQYGGEPYWFKVYLQNIKTEKDWINIKNLILEYKNERSWFEVEYQQDVNSTIYFGFNLPKGYKYKIANHFDVNIPQNQTYFGSASVESIKETIPVATFSVNIPQSNIYLGSKNYMSYRLEVRNG